MRTDNYGRAAPAPWVWRALLAFAVVSAVVVTFLPVVHNGWIPLDDEENFLHNPDYRGLGPDQIGWMFTTSRLGHYQPLSWVTLGVDYLLWGMDARGYHATSLAIHAANGVLLMALAWILFGHSERLSRHPRARAAGALFAALFFALHPLRVESVAWVTERRDVLCGFFSLLTLLAAVSDRLTERRRRILLPLLYAAAVLSKGIAVALPVAVLALDLLGLTPGGRRTLRDAVRIRFPLLVVAALSAASTLWASAGARANVGTIGIGQRIAAVSYSLCFYVVRTVVPLHLRVFMPWPRLQPVSLSTTRFALATAAVVLAAGLLLLLWRRVPTLLAGAVVYAAFLLPVSGVFQAGPQLVAHRYSYLACWPWALLLGFGAALIAVGAGWGRRAELGVLALAVLVGLALETREQIPLWHDGLSFTRAAVAGAPDAWQPRFLLARCLIRDGQWKAAAEQLQVGLSQPPLERPIVTMAALLLSTCPDPHRRNGRAAVALATRAARVSEYADANALYALAAAQAESGDYSAAAATARSALSLKKPARKALAVRLQIALADFEQGRPLRLAPAEWL
jgi:hypothetical protein